MKKILLTTLLLFAVYSAGAQTGLWGKTDKAILERTEKAERAAMPVSYSLFSHDLAQLKQLLHGAPLRGKGQVSNLVLAFPDAVGTMQNYRIYEAPVMHPQLSEKHVNIHSYTGQGIEDPAATIRFSVTVYGLHAMILSPKGTVYIDPYSKDGTFCIAYYKASLFEERSFSCDIEEPPHSTKRSASAQVPAANDGVLRTYRLAMACTAEYAAYHVNAAGLNNGSIAQQKAAVLAAMAVTITRINGIYERELAVTMELVPDNESIVFIGTDSFENNNNGILIGQSQSVIDGTIGSANYDIGHTVSTGAGGLAQLGSVCSGLGKAKGVTGTAAPVGDPFDIDYVAHEMGHQFGGNHIFNGTDGSCGGNLNNSTSVEPGSGTTIMGYAGICGGADVQFHSDPYFNTVSMAEIFDVLTAINCAQETDIANSAPVAGTLVNKTIPVGTALLLRGSGVSDAQGDALTYCWEQTDGVTNNNAHSNTPSSFATQGPNYRSRPPSENQYRYLPELAEVLQGNLYAEWEVTPDVSRTFNFAYTVRDNNAMGGQTTRRNMTVNVTANAGPFVVTSQADDNLTWVPGEQETITWDVAGTDANGVNATAVNIFLSTNGGQSFDVLLLANTPNDGEEAITVPTVLAPFCRIMVEAADNIFYAVNPVDFSVGYFVTNECTTYNGNGPITIPDNSAAFTTDSAAVTGGSSVSSVQVSINATHSYVGDLVFKLKSPAGTDVVLWQQQCGTGNNMNVTFSDAAANVACGNPTQGTYHPVGSLTDFNGENPVGNWQLEFSDSESGDTGTLNSWSVQVCSYVFTPAAIKDFGFKDFKLYPNPAADMFTVAFVSASQSPVSIAVYDVRGRQVYNNSFKNTGLFSGNVNLQGAEKGVYLVTVQDGNRKITRKVVIQ